MHGLRKAGITVYKVDRCDISLNSCFAVLSLLGELLSLQTKWEQSNEVLRQALTLQREQLSPNHYQTARCKPCTMYSCGFLYLLNCIYIYIALFRMGENLLSQGLYVNAEKLFRDAMEMQQCVLSLNHAERARSNLGLPFFVTENDLFYRIYTYVVGLLGVGTCMSYQQRWEDGEVHLQEAVRILTDCLPYHPRTAQGSTN